ncbi:hypothetical protein [Sporosarcina limicola]|uniref:Uncharacterized protein n=1 Tax=Sporosarcina limicola TaxID=34101 RepID=A0A927MN20_9BACL|nr:hypothetical protein [Sporosarcina limicola]MBE1554216.1 hypothetical protein [Sporosarcina limicola]
MIRRLVASIEELVTYGEKRENSWIVADTKTYTFSSFKKAKPVDGFAF